jgi:hypothetical protein
MQKQRRSSFKEGQPMGGGGGSYKKDGGGRGGTYNNGAWNNFSEDLEFSESLEHSSSKQPPGETIDDISSINSSHIHGSEKPSNPLEDMASPTNLSHQIYGGTEDPSSK